MPSAKVISSALSYQDGHFLLHSLDRHTPLHAKLETQPQNMHPVDDRLEAQLSVRTCRRVQPRLWQWPPVRIHAVPDPSAVSMCVVGGDAGAVAAGTGGPASVQAKNVIPSQQQLLCLSSGHGKQLGFVD